MSALKRIIVRAITEDPDGTTREIAVATDNRDRIKWDLYRSRSKWPMPTDAPSLWATFLAWSALRRTGATAQDFEAFSETVVAADAEAVDVDPTPTATGAP